MARKLKTYQTSLGFFEQAIAAPSMKAALEAWGADSNLFHQGAAKESHGPDVITATMAKPGVVLKRAVGRSLSRPADKAAERKAALAYEREQKRRDREREREEAARQKKRERRQRAVAAAQDALSRAKIAHEEKKAAIDNEREAV